MSTDSFAMGDRVIFATSCRLTMNELGIPWHRRDVAQLSAIATVVHVSDRTTSYPLAIKLPCGSRINAVACELTLVERAPSVEVIVVAEAARQEAA